MADSTDRKHWSSVAQEWIAWARAPNHDAFWAYRAALRDFIGQGQGDALDLGCGEGRVSRELKSLGYRVTATDAVVELAQAAAEAGSADEYVVADAKALPLKDNRFDLVVSYNLLMDVDDVLAVLTEARRVMRATGRLLISIVHPFADRGRFAGTAADAPFVREGTYFGRQRFEGMEERNGLRMRFAGWSQPLEAYARYLRKAGFVIAALREPLPDTSEGRGHLAKWTRMPLFLWLDARIWQPESD